MSAMPPFALLLLVSLYQCVDANDLCERTYDGFPGTTCNPSETECPIICLSSSTSLPTPCRDMNSGTMDCRDDLCRLCTCESSDNGLANGIESIEEITCEAELRQLPAGLPASLKTFSWVVDRSQGITIAQLRRSSFRQNNHLQEIHFIGIGISHVNTDFFDNLSSLKVLELSSNLKNFPFESLHKLSKLEKLQITASQLKTFDMHWLLQNTHVFYLQLINNQLSQWIPLENGETLPEVRTLWLRSNPLMQFDNLARGLINLRRLSIGATRITYLTHSMFDESLHDLHSFEATQSAIVHIPFALLTDVMRLPTPGEFFEVVMEENPSSCSIIERPGKRRSTFFNVTCTCALFYSNRVIIMEHMTHCPLPIRLPCPFGDIPLQRIRLDQFCDGVTDCRSNADEICNSQMARPILIAQNPPGCLQQGLGLPNGTCSMGMRLFNGQSGGHIYVDDEIVADVHGIYEGVREPNVYIGIRSAGYIVDVPATHIPIPIKGVFMFDQTIYMRVYLQGKTTGPYCEAQFSQSPSNPSTSLPDADYAFPETLDENPNLKEVVPSYQKISGNEISTYSSAISISDEPTSTATEASGLKTQQAVTGSVIGGVVGSVVLITVLVVAVLLLHRRNLIGNNRSSDIEMTELLLQRSRRIFAVEYPKLIASDADGFELQFQSLAIPRSKIHLSRNKIDLGRFGAIHNAKFTCNNVFTTATAHILSNEDIDLRLEFLVQARVLLALSRHPGILSLLALSIDREPCMFLTEIMPNGTLQQFFDKYSSNNIGHSFAQSDLVQCIHKLAAGLTYIESRFIVHRNLSLSNIHVGLSLSDVRIAGFALARNVYRSDVYVASKRYAQKSLHISPLGSESSFPNRYGVNSKVSSSPIEGWNEHLRYAAPEVIEDGEFTIKTDVYAFGVIMHEILRNGEPMSVHCLAAYRYKDVEKEAHMSTIIPSTSNLGIIIRSCVQVQPSARPHFDALHTKLTFTLQSDGEILSYNSTLNHESDRFDPFALSMNSSSTSRTHLRTAQPVQFSPENVCIQSSLLAGMHLVGFGTAVITQSSLCFIARVAMNDSNLNMHAIRHRDIRAINSIRSPRFLSAFGTVDGLVLQKGGHALHCLVVSLDDCQTLDTFLESQQGLQLTVAQQLLVDLASIVEQLVLHKNDPANLSEQLLFVSGNRLFAVFIPNSSNSTQADTGLMLLIRMVEYMFNRFPKAIRSKLHDRVLPLIAKNQTEGCQYRIQSFSEAIILLHQLPDENKEVSWSSLDFVKELGSGQFGEVQLMTLKQYTNRFQRHRFKKRGLQLVAVKTLLDKTCANEFLEEMRLMGKIRHPNLVSMLYVITNEQPLGMVLEYLPHGSLDQWLERTATPMSVEDMLLVLYQIACGAGELVRLGIVHRDIAARNVLLGPNLLCKLSDYGLSRLMRAGDADDTTYYMLETNRSLPLRWTAPEILLTKKFTTATDVYAYGMLIYELLTKGTMPFPQMDDQQLVAYLARNARQPSNKDDHVVCEKVDSRLLQAPSQTNPAIAKLFYLTTSVWPKRRPTFFEIIALLSPHNVDDILEGNLPPLLDPTCVPELNISVDISDESFAGSRYLSIFDPKQPITLLNKEEDDETHL